jgi:hypothetical protein
VILFDSANPTGNDFDLGTPNEDFGGPGTGEGGGAGEPGENSEAQGMMLILAENLKGGNPASDPDDSGNGGDIYFDFDEPFRVDYIKMVDVDGGENENYVEALDADGNVLRHVSIPSLGDNAYQEVYLNVGDVSSLHFYLTGSGSVSAIPFCDDTPAPTPTSQPTNTPTNTPTSTPTSTPLPLEGVVIAVEPAFVTGAVSGTIQVAVEVRAGVQQVDGASAYLDFDPTVLQVQQITKGDTFQVELQNDYDNTNGTIDFAAGSFGSYPSGTIELFLVEFEAIGATSSTPLAFVFDAPRQSDVTFSGTSVLDAHLDGTVELLTPSVPPGSFNVTSEGDGMLLTWTTSSEEGVEGFNAYRSSEGIRLAEGDSRQKLNDALITANGTSSSYQLSDSTGDSSYDYWLEYVMEDGSGVMHPDSASETEPASITLNAASSTPRSNSWLWALLPIGLTILAGALMRRRSS